ncbi:MAG: hypothetical protein NC123_15445 [Butyrivibrio sp.]|nr:hypothetical protein [Acetatifactor muris]MCM1560915.1 hypothetical protein [Butyrivibrio sp.]
MVGIGAVVCRVALEFAKGVGTSVAPEVITVVSDLLKKKLENFSEKLSKPAREAVEQAGEAGDVNISAEVLDELRGHVREVLKEYSSPVYADCVTFWIDGSLSDREQELMQEVLTNVNEDDGDWEEEEAKEQQDIVDEIINRHVGSDVSMGDDCYIGEDYISLNFSDYADKTYCGEDMRKLADALNYFLGGRYIRSFSLE